MQTAARIDYDLFSNFFFFLISFAGEIDVASTAWLLMANEKKEGAKRGGF